MGGEDGHPRYTLGEEVAHAVTHGIGVALAVAGMTALLVLAAQKGDPWRLASFIVYGVSLVLLYLSSTLYHAIPNPNVKQIFRVMDHVSIFLLIAGTYTPFLLVSLRETVGWMLFGVIWGIALLGIIAKIAAVDRWEKLSLLAYVGMGWLCVTAFGDLLETVPSGGIAWLVAGGLSYTGGVGFYVWESFPFNHAIWHLFVLGGSVCHYLAILLYVLPQQT